MKFKVLSSRFSVFLREKSKYRALANREIVRKTVKELVDGPYILRFHLSNEGLTYFVGNDENYLHFKEKNKNVHWLHDLFESIRQDLIEKEFPSPKSIYNWPVETLMAHGATLTVFSGAEVLSEEEVQEMNKKGFFDPSEREEG